MISSKYITRVSVALMAVVLILCVLAVGYTDHLAVWTQTDGITMEYPTVLFDQNQVTEIQILMDEDEWNNMLNNAMAEEYYECQVTVGGKAFYQVGIRPKGNTSLSSIAMDPDNNRYSFKLEFDHFVDGQTCFGLDKLALNNNYADSTNMKEALIYDMFQFLGADAPLYNYATISVNGEYWGVYLAIEGVEESFMMRNYGMQDGHLYKPDSMNQNPNEEAQGGGFGGFGRGGGSNLNYTNDSLDSYSSIWYGAVNDSTETDHKRVVTALKAISEGENLEQYMDVDNLLRYMAVHNFSVNEDSLSGMMSHNYYLYEADGQLNIIPWDYNLSFGGMGGHGGNGATSVINDPIDDSYQSTRFFDCLLKNEEYKARYHEYYNRLITEYFDGGFFDEAYNRIRTQIDELVKEDPNQMYSYEAYQKGADTLYQVMKLRAESVRGQLDGTIPATAAEQSVNQDALVDGSSINISDMGSFMGGGFGR